MKRIENKKKAFTLAEILITLTIVGVLAAVTIPALSKKSHNQEYVAGCMKAYNTLVQATEQILIQHGNPKTWIKETKDNDNNVTLTKLQSVQNMYKQYINHLKACDDGCITNDYAYLGSGKYPAASNYTSSDTEYNGAWLDKPKLITNDGMLIIFELANSSCNTTDDGVYNTCASIYVDINGNNQPPNQVGRDMFAFFLKEDKLVPAGIDTPEDASNYNCKSGGAGWMCASKIIIDGKMDY